ncbi:heptaprenyl diphosphate synthase component II [Paenibacillus senegalensis]|uniref:heptaprenyl diphosphate synthase component II n=1 Tax=Paenibacillus senegalensis TaxID=1465766 RepID=UPI000287B8C9|nr:heptaprenyl diphosphate synthase component II [Paenibacillus senegalensis]
MKILDLYARMKKDLSFIEKELEKNVDSDHPELRKSSAHLLKAGGKRLRPIFVLLAGQFGQYDINRLKYIAVSLELIHMATLVHDDVIDDADTRRGQLTVKSKWDNRVAMYTGDYILGKALGVVTQLPNPQIHQIMSHAMVEVCIGEMEQIRFFYNTNQTVRNYLLRIKRKTALLIAVSCQLGAIAAGASKEVSDQLYRYGYSVGMAFQIRDDLLDIIGSEKELGKPPGSDIKQGNITLPVLYALQEDEVREELILDIDRVRKAKGQMDVAPILQKVKQTCGMHRAESLAARYIDRAIEAISSLPDIQAKKDLTKVAHFVGNRSY